MKNLVLFIFALVLLALLIFRWFHKKNSAAYDSLGKIDEILKQNIDWLEKRGYTRKLSFDFAKDGWVKNGIFIPYDALIDPEQPDKQHGLEHEKFTQRVCEIEKKSPTGEGVH